MKLTKRACERAQYPFEPKTERRFVLWDDDVRGFGLRIYPSGRKVFLFRCEVSGRQRWMQLGDFGPMTVQQARTRARSARVEADDGGDPAEARRKRRQKAKTLRDLAAEYMTNNEGKWKPSTTRCYRQILDGHLLPIFGRMQPAAITVEDVSRFHHRLRKTPYQANRAVWLLGALLDRAARLGLREGPNPCSGGKHALVKRYKEKSRNRYLPAEELVRFADALAELEDARRVSRHAGAALRLLLFTGARVGEILKLRWEDIDFGNAVALVREHKTDGDVGDKTIYLNAPALEVLASLPRSGSPWVIRGQGEGDHMKDLKRPWRRVCEVAKIKNARIHDLRHTVGSWSAIGGASLLIVGKMLGHRQVSTTERYVHLSADPVREVAERVGAAIKGAMDGKAAEVVPIERRR